MAKGALTSEADFQAQVIQLAELYGFRAGHFADSRRQVKPGVFVGDRLAAGIPDLILVRERAVWAELKTGKGRLREEQRVWLDALANGGAEVYLWRPSDLEEIQRILSRRWRHLPRGNRATQTGREWNEPSLQDNDGVRITVFQPVSLWVGGGRAAAAPPRSEEEERSIEVGRVT